MHNRIRRGRTASAAPFRFGLAACGVFALAGVLARGVRWDETWEHAQLLAGTVAYPPGHPLALYVHNAFSFQTWLSAWLLEAGVGPHGICGFRNFLFLLASILPVYCLTAILTRAPLAGLAAALLLLQGILLEFDGSYPSMVWPELYSNGHIGGGAALLGLCALVAGRTRIAYFLVGLLPCVHLGQWPPLAGTAALHALRRIVSAPASAPAGPKDPPWLAALGWGGVGLACCIGYGVLHWQALLPLPESGPFARTADWREVWRGYTAHHDPHRAFPPGNGHVILAGTLALCALGACSGRCARLRHGSWWLGCYTGLIAAAVWGTMAIHGVLGEHIPFTLIAWMPYRLINHLPPIALALATAIILTRWPRYGWWLLGAALIAGLGHPIWHRVVGPDLYQRYIAGGEGIFFGWYGLAVVAAAPMRGRARVVVVVLAVAAVLLLAAYHQFGAACLVAGMVAGYVVYRIGPPPGTVSPWTMRAVSGIAGVAALALLAHQAQFRRSLPVSPFEASVRARLVASDALLIGPPDSVLLQATTGQPVLAEAATPSLISYVPAIGPGIDRLYRDVYGRGFLPDDSDTVPWETVWQSRSADAWNALGARYGLTHVIAPAGIELDLPVVLRARDYGLYAIAESNRFTPASPGH